MPPVEIVQSVYTLAAILTVVVGSAFVDIILTSIACDVITATRHAAVNAHIGPDVLTELVDEFLAPD